MHTPTIPPPPPMKNSEAEENTKEQNNQLNMYLENVQKNEKTTLDVFSLYKTAFQL